MIQLAIGCDAQTVSATFHPRSFRLHSLHILFVLVSDEYKGETFCGKVRFQIFTAAIMKMSVVWRVAPCSVVQVYQRFGGAYCLHHQVAVCSVMSSKIDRSYKNSVLWYIPAETSVWLVVALNGACHIPTRCNKWLVPILTAQPLALVGMYFHLAMKTRYSNGLCEPRGSLS
jgi:hypothetical protein